MLLILWTAKKTIIEVMDKSGTNEAFGQNNKTKGCLHWSPNEKGRFRSPYHHGKAGRKTREGETERTNDG